MPRGFELRDPVLLNFAERSLADYVIDSLAVFAII